MAGLDNTQDLRSTRLSELASLDASLRSLQEGIENDMSVLNQRAAIAGSRVEFQSPLETERRMAGGDISSESSDGEATPPRVDRGALPRPSPLTSTPLPRSGVLVSSSWQGLRAFLFC